MSVLIKGMEMPVIELEWTIRHGADGKWYAIDTNAETSDGEWHEIVPVPPHGKPGDLDALYDHMCEAHDKWRENPEQYMSINPFADDETMVLYAPTIVPADEPFGKSEQLNL